MPPLTVGSLATTIHSTLQEYMKPSLTHCGLLMPWIWVTSTSACSGNGLLCGGSKTLPEPMLTNHQWGPLAFRWGQFHRNSSNCHCLNITYLEIVPHLPRANGLNHSATVPIHLYKGAKQKRALLTHRSLGKEHCYFESYDFQIYFYD